MFLSAQYAAYTSLHPISLLQPRQQVRILPKSLYGKNAPMAELPHSFFSHFYGSSWHADDAGFVSFLGNSGITVMWIAGGIVGLLLARLGWQKYQGRKHGYQLVGAGFERDGGGAGGARIRGRGEDMGIWVYLPAAFRPTRHAEYDLPLTARRRSEEPVGIFRAADMPPPYDPNHTMGSGAVKGKQAVELDEVDQFIHDNEGGSALEGEASDEDDGDDGQAWTEWKDDK